MFSNKNIDTLDSNLLQFYEKNLSEKFESLAFQVLDSPTLYSGPFVDFDPTKIIFRSRKMSDLIGLAIFSWYAPEEIRILIQLALEEFTWASDKFNYDVKEILLTSKEYSLAWLVLQDCWNEYDFYGNIINRKFVFKINNFLSFKRISRKKVKRYSGYCRGYRDSNQRGPKPLPPELLWTREEEEKRKLSSLMKKQSTLQFIMKIEELLAS